jgi:tricorn protease
VLRQPDVSDNHVVFAYGGDLWVATRAGGDARRLTSFPGVELDPKFSPDGTQVAFSGAYDGNLDVYVVSVDGGEPQRLTWHPDADFTRGWTRDGSEVIFASGRDTAPIGYPKFWTIGLEGGFPEAMPVPRAWRGQLAPGGDKLAYEPVASWETEWRNYRGGQNKPIWILDLDDLSLEKLPWDGSNDMNPVYLGDTIYFLSDRDHANNVWTWDSAARELRQVTFFDEYDVKNLESGGGALVFENGGYLYTMTPGDDEPRRLEIHVRGDFPWARPHWEDVARFIRGFDLSPSGMRAVFEARGEIFTVPADKGDIRNLTRSSGAAEREPSWSPDGKNIAWFSDEGGEYGLIIADQLGGEPRRIDLERPTFYYTAAWSPDSSHIAYGDADRNLWVTEANSGETVRIDDEGYAHPTRTIYPAWSPDSKWIAYTKRLDNQYNAVWVYSMEDGSTHPVTDGMANSLSPVWDKGGKYLYFLGSTDYGINVGWLDMSSYDHPETRAIYLAVLAADEPSPLLPESDDENGEEDDEEGGTEKDDEEADEEEVPEVRIDFDGLAQRILALDVPEGEYLGLLAGEEGVLFYFETDDGDDPGGTLHRYKLEDRESEVYVTKALGATSSADGKKILFLTADRAWGISDASAKPDPEEDMLDLSQMRMKVDPVAEWKQIFREAWRYQRDYFYVDNVHGLDLDDVYRRYSEWIGDLRHRDDLTHLLDVLGGETAVGHSFAAGGDAPDVPTVPVGLLGVDFEVHADRYRIVKIYDGESWNPELSSPLRGPGVDVEEGDYLISVNGTELRAGTNPYSLFDNTAGRQVRLEVSASAKGKNRRETTVVPVGNEGGLRRREWEESNRRKVAEMSDGKLGYVWLPNTGVGGYNAFNRYYFAQKDKQGVVIDERFNGGGSAADYMIDVMSRTLMGYFNNPLGENKPFTNPNAGIWGPKVMVINDAAGSGGDLLPYMFREKKIGPLVGTRTWGGLVGIWDVPPLVDGGFITSPRGGFFDNDGRWAVENEGVAPDIEVEMLPAEVAKGRDPQLEKAVEVALELLEKSPVKLQSQPADPVRVRRPRR